MPWKKREDELYNKEKELRDPSAEALLFFEGDLFKKAGTHQTYTG